MANIKARIWTGNLDGFVKAAKLLGFSVKILEQIIDDCVDDDYFVYVQVIANTSNPIWKKLQAALEEI